MSQTIQGNLVWTAACPYDRLIPGFGLGVLLDDHSQAALFLAPDQKLYAIGNIDPIWHAPVLARGIVGDRAGRLVVQSPLRKQAFALDDGSCLDNPRFSVPTYQTRVRDDGIVEVGREVTAH